MFKYLTILLLTLVTGAASADSTTVYKDKLENKIGIGVNLNSIIEFNFFTISSGGTIYLPIRYSSKVLLEPFLSAYHLHQSDDGYNNGDEWVDYRLYSVGVGIFSIKRTRQVDWMLGFRLEKKWRREDSNRSYYDGKITSNEFFISPVIGAEYSFLGGFSVGAEISLQTSNFKESQDNYSYSRQRTRTDVLLRYYF